MKEPVLYVCLPLPYYNSNQLIRTLRSEKNFYKDWGLGVPNPEIYRSHLQKIMLEGGSSWLDKDDVRDINNALFAGGFRRVLISTSMAIGNSFNIVDEQGLLPGLETAIERIVQTFQDCKIVFLFGLVDPGSLIPTLVQANLISEVKLRSIFPKYGWFWSDAIGGCIDDHQRISVVAWKHESAHFLWPKILRTISAASDGLFLPGCLDMIKHSITDEGFNRLVDYLYRSPRKDDEFVSLVLNKFNQEYRRRDVRVVRKRLPAWPKWASCFAERDYEEDLAILKSDAQVYLVT